MTNIIPGTSKELLYQLSFSECVWESWYNARLKYFTPGEPTL